jgi:hypothetical protein
VESRPPLKVDFTALQIFQEQQLQVSRFSTSLCPVQQRIWLHCLHYTATFLRCSDVTILSDGSVRLGLLCENLMSMKQILTLRGLSSRATCTDRATASFRRSYCQLFRIEECRADSGTDPYDSILVFLDRSRYIFFQVAPQLYSQG